jgi:Helix-turn-helix domain
LCRYLTKQLAFNKMTELVLTTKTDLQDLVREAVQQALSQAPRQSTPPEALRYFDVEAAAEYMGCAPTTIYAYLKKGLRSIKLGGLKFTKEWLDEFMQSHKRKTVADIVAEAEDRLLLMRHRPQGHKKGGRK